MSNNKLYTLSYFRKRLKDAGFNASVIIDDYTDDDYRYWTIKLLGKMNVLCTCYRDSDNKATNKFEFWDGGNFYKNRLVIETDSMQVIIAHIQKIQDDMIAEKELKQLEKEME